MWSRQWWRDVGERCLDVFAGAMAVLLGHDVTTTGLDVRAVDWVTDLSFASGCTLLYLLKSFPSVKFGDPNTASFLPAAQNPRGRHEKT